MFEKYMIVEDDVQNVVENGKITGFQFGARLPYYRGLGLSMVEEIGVKIDAEEIPQSKIKFTVHGNTYSLAQMETEPEDRWEMGEVAYITIPKEGGLTKGEHKINLMLNLRISYMPFPSIRLSEKTITL
jgi:Domain of unknown function (DUF6379)